MGHRRPARGGRGLPVPLPCSEPARASRSGPHHGRKPCPGRPILPNERDRAEHGCHRRQRRPPSGRRLLSPGQRLWLRSVRHDHQGGRVRRRPDPVRRQPRPRREDRGVATAQRRVDLLRGFLRRSVGQDRQPTAVPEHESRHRLHRQRRPAELELHRRSRWPGDPRQPVHHHQSGLLPGGARRLGRLHIGPGDGSLRRPIPVAGERPQLPRPG